MKNRDHDQNLLEDLLEGITREIKCSPKEVKHELADLLAGVDRDVVKLREKQAHNRGDYAPLSNQLMELAIRFKTKQPALSKIAQELMEHLTRMGL